MCSPTSFKAETRESETGTGINAVKGMNQLGTIDFRSVQLLSGWCDGGHMPL